MAAVLLAVLLPEVSSNSASVGVRGTQAARASTTTPAGELTLLSYSSSVLLVESTTKRRSVYTSLL